MLLLTIYLPWLLNMLPYSYWVLTCCAALPTYSAFMISVRQASDLPPASFRFPVTQDTLALGYILPAVGRIRDFHPLKHAPAGRTENQDLISEILEKTFCFFVCLIDRERFTPPMSGRFRFFRHRSAFFHSQSTNSEADSFHWLYSYFSSLSMVVENGTNMSQ